MEITNFLYGIIMISLISLVVLIAYTLYFYYKYFTRENPLPGPFPLPLIGNTHQIFKNFSLDLKELDKYGDLCEFYMGTERIILLGNDDLIQKMMKPVINGPFQNRVNDDVEGLKEIGVLNTGLVFNNNYDEWKFHRKFFTKVMMSSSFIEQSVTAVQDSFSEMEKYWEKLGNTIEFNYWMKRYFFDALFITTTSKPAYASANYYNEITQNEKSDVPESILKESNMFIESADLFIKCLVYFFLIPKVIRNFPGINRLTRYLKDRIGWLKNNVHAIVKSKREEISKTPIDQELKSDMLTMFLTVNTERDITEKIADDLNDKPMSDKDIVANFIEVLSIGIDTVSNSMCFLVNFLENNPKVKQRMIEEIESVLGKDPNSIITSKDLSKLEYVEATIKEASRLKTVVPMNFKKNSVPEVIGNYKWSKDTNFLLYYDRIQKNSSHWKDSNTFNPDRFIDNNNSNNKYQSLTFGGGMRVCPGRSLAMNELKVTLTMLYRKYDIEQIGPIKDHIMTIRSCDELKVRLKKKTCNKQ